jgi:hypothetical protein
MFMIVLATIGGAAALTLATLTLTIWLLAYIGWLEDQTENISKETAQRIALRAIELPVAATQPKNTASP